MANELPNTNNILEDLFGGGNQTLSQFADQLIPFAIKFVLYSNEMAKSDSEIVNNTNSAVEALRVLSNLATDVVGDINLSGFGSSLLSFGEQFKTYADQVTSIDTNELDRIISSISNLKGLINSIIDEGYISDDVSFDMQLHGMMASLIFILQESEENFKITGAQLVTAFIEAMLLRFQESTMLITERSYQIGRYLVEGVRSGVTENLSIIDSAGDLLASNLITKVNDILGIASPSKEGMKSGMYYAVGVGIGIDKNKKIPVDSAGNMSIEILDEAKEILSDNNLGEILDEEVANDIKNNVNKVTESVKEVAKTAVDEVKSTVEKQMPELSSVFKKSLSNIKSVINVGSENASDEFTDFWTKLGGGGIFGIGEAIDSAVSGVSDSISGLSSLTEKASKAAGKSAKKIVDIDNEMLSEEEEYWRTLLRIKRQGAEADKYNALSVKEFEQEVFEETLDIWEKYTDKLQSTSSSVMNSRNLFDPVDKSEVKTSSDNLFDEINKSEAKSKDELFKNLDDQIEEYRQYGEILSSITFRLGDDSTLASYLKDLGVSSLEQLKVINSMTDEELTKYAESYDKKYKYMANVTKKETAVSKKELFKNLDDQIEEYRQYAETLATVTSRLGEDNNLASYIRTLGIDSLEQLKVINSMTDEELTRYSQLYDTKYAYATNIASQQITDFRKETESELEQLYGTMPGSIDLQQFAENFTGTFDSITSYLNNVALPMNESIKASMEALSQSAAESITTNSDYIVDALDQTFDDVKSIYDDRASEYGEETGGYIDQGIAKGIEDSTASLEAAEQNIDDIRDAYREAAEIQSPSQLMANEVGLYLTEGVGKGMTSRIAQLYLLKSAIQVVNYIIDRFNEKKERFEEAGKNASYGFANGLYSGIKEIIDSGNLSIQSVTTSLDESSSESFRKIGQNAILEFAYGIKDLNTLPGDEMKKATDEGIKVAEYAINSIHNILENGADDQFTIRPVMDLTNIQEGVKRLSNLVSINKGFDVSSSAMETEQLKLQQAQKGLIGTNYTFNQYNTSPKALSTVDIYRQTKNQFSRLKEAISK